MPLHAYLPQDRRRALVRGRALPVPCRGAVLFSDISGFTPLTEALTQGAGQRRGVDELARRINAVSQALVEEVEREGGSVIGFAGDGMTCWFDETDGDAAARALRCAHAMQRAMARFPGLAVKAGLAAGPALRVAAGDPALHRIDLLAGATVARAVAAQEGAAAAEVWVDDALARSLGAAALGTPRRSAGGETFHPHRIDGAGPEATKPLPPEDPVPEPEALRPWVPPFVFEREIASGGLFATDLRPAAAFFVHLAQGTAAVGDDAEGEAAALSASVVHVQRALQDHGGVLLEASVDGRGLSLYGSFGAAQAHEDDAERALRAALALRETFEAQRLAARFGLSAGTLCVGGYGGTTRRSFGGLGDEVNTAARLMGQAAAGEILVSGRLRRLGVGDEFLFEPRPPLAVKGKAEPLAVYALAGLQQRRAIRLQAPPAPLPLVGRTRERARLEAAVDAARAGRAQVLRIVGEAGIGKSRLLAEGVRLARRAGFVGYGGAAGADGVRTPYRLWQGVWTAFFDLDPTLPQRRQRQAVQATLERETPAHAEAWPLVAAVLGQDWPDTPFTAALQPRDRKTLLESVLLGCLQAAAADAAPEGGGLLVVLEDLHAADPLSLDLLDRLLRGVADLPVLVLTTERPAEGGALLPLAPGSETLVLGGLADEDVEQIVRAKLALLFPQRAGTVPRELLAQVVARAQGNPFYVEELLDDLHDRGLDPQSAGAVRALDWPGSLHSLVLSRMDRLPASQRDALKAASIIGREFTLADLEGYCPTLGSAEALAADLRELGRLDFTPALPGAPEPAHLFRHRVTLEVCYDSIDLATRARLHGLYARHLERRQAGAPTLAATLAHHYACAGEGAQAVVWLQRAGEQAAARFANEEALAHYEGALAWIAADDAPARFELLARRQPLLDLMGRHDLQRRELDEIEALAARLPDADLRRAQAAVLRARLALGLGDYAAARAAAQGAVDRLGQGAAPALRVDALQQLAGAMLHSGDSAAARPVLDAAFAAAQALGDAARQAAALSSTGIVLWQGGSPQPAAQALKQALALAREVGDLRLQLNVLNNLGVVAKSRSRFAESARHYEDALAIARRIGDRSGEAMLLNNLGSACLAGGRFDEASHHCEQAAQRFAEAGETASHATALANCAEAHRELGRTGPALALTEQALALFRASGARPGEALALENLGLAEAAAGRAAEAQSHLQAAAALAREIGLPGREASALLHLGQLCTAAGAVAAAAEALGRAEALAAPLGDETLALEIDAAHALLGLARQAPPAALLQRLEPVLLRWSATDGDDTPALPLRLQAAALQVLRACGNARAPALHERARRELVERAAAIPDAAARRGFLDLPAHRALLAG